MSLPNEYESKKYVKAAVYKESPRLVMMKPDECKKLCEAVSLEYQKGFESRIIERITSTESVDRDGDIIRAKGIDNSQFRTEPVVLFAHNKDDIPIGRSLKEWIDNKLPIVGWKSQDVFFDNDIDTTGRSDLIFRLVRVGGMRGGSIGFLPITAKYDHTDEERKKLGLGKYGIEFIKVLKLEHSACSVPANQEALAAGLKAIDSNRLLKAIHKEDLDIMEKQKLFDGDLIDVFSSVLGVKKIISIPKDTKVTSKEDEIQSQPIINLNIDISEINNKLCSISNDIETFTSNIKEVHESLTEQFSNLITTADKLVSVIEQKETSKGLYDTSELSGILKLDG